MSAIQSALIASLDCPDSELAQVISELIMVPSDQWDWALCHHWASYGVHDLPGADDFSASRLRWRLTMAIGARLDYWREIDHRLGFGPEVTARHAKPGVDVLIRMMYLDPDEFVRYAALAVLKKFEDITGLAALALGPVGVGFTDDLTRRDLVGMIRQLTAGQQN